MEIQDDEKKKKIEEKKKRLIDKVTGLAKNGDKKES
jgi:hypothetical protein